MFQRTGHLSNKEHRPDILLIIIFKKDVISHPCKVMEGWILSGVSAPHGVSVQEEGLRCARSAQSTVDVFTTSTERVVLRQIFPHSSQLTYHPIICESSNEALFAEPFHIHYN